MKKLKRNLGFVGLGAFALFLLLAVVFEVYAFGCAAMVLFLALSGYCMLFYDKPVRRT